jgi:hypothetical protein
MSETEGDNILNSLKNYSSNFSSIPTRRELLNTDTDTLDIFLQNGGSKNQIKGVRYLSENEESDDDNDSNSENLSEMYGGKKNKPSPSDQYHQESIDYLKDDLQLSPLEARAYKSLAYRYIKENNSTSTSLEKAKLMLALVKSENFLNEFKDKLDETMKIIESIDSEKEKKLLSEQNNTKSEEEEKKEEKKEEKTKKKQKGGSKIKLKIGTKVIYHLRIGKINDIIESPGEDTLYTIVFDDGPEVMLHESDIVLYNNKESIENKLQQLQKELAILSTSASGSDSGASGSGSGISYTSDRFFPGIKIPNNINKFEIIDPILGQLFSVNNWSREYIKLNNCPSSLDGPSFVLEPFPQIFTPEVNAAFDLVHTPAGGSCLIHAFLLGLSRPYQYLLSDLDRQICGDVFRRHVLGTKYLHIFIESDQRDLMAKPVILPDSVRADLTNGTVYVYENLEAGTVPDVLSDILKINVLILSPTGLYQLIDKHDKSPFIIIYGNGGHYSICLLKGKGTIVDRGPVLRFCESIQRKIDAVNAARLEANAASASAASSGRESASAPRSQGESSAASAPRVPSPSKAQGASGASASSLSSLSRAQGASGASAPSPVRLPGRVMYNSLAALIGLQTFPSKASLKYPPLDVYFLKNKSGKITFATDVWMTLFVEMNGFSVNKENFRIDNDEKTTLDGFSKLVIDTFTIVETLNNNNTSLIHAYLFARSNAYKQLLKDDDRQTCVNVFIEKVLKNERYKTKFKTEDKYTFLNNVVSSNLLLLKNLSNKKSIDIITSFESVAVKTIYFDGRNYNVCILKKSKKFLFPYASLDLFKDK